MSFKEGDCVAVVKGFRIHKQRVLEYRVCRGTIYNTVSYHHDKKHYCLWSDGKQKGQGWFSQKYIFSNVLEANEFCNKQNQILEIDRKAREEKKKL